MARDKLASYKRIIICSDGTWLASNLGTQSYPSNVARMARAIAKSGLDDDGNVVKQIVSYHPGLGSGDLPIQKAIYGGVGWGLDNDVTQIYDFIANNYEPGDELFFFGFSRGAFTVRSVASLVCDVGVLSAVRMSRFPELWAAYRKNTSGEPFTKSEWYLDNKDELGLMDVKVKVVGVWDTVGALGVPDFPLVSLAKAVGLPINKEYAFHNTSLSKNLDYAFQALAIDERRLTFPPTLWHKTADGPAKDLQQCWFPGIHANIGGQREDPYASVSIDEMGHNSFAWMVDNLSGNLTFEDVAIKTLIEEHRRAINAIGNPNNSWGCGPIGNDFAGLQGLFFRLLGKQDRTPGSYPRDPGDGTTGATNEYFHPIARIRKNNLNYRPASLQGYVVDKLPNGGWQWAKQGVQAVPEYVLRPDKKISLAYEDGGTVKYRQEDSLSRLLCPSGILFELDSDISKQKQEIDSFGR